MKRANPTAQSRAAIGRATAAIRGESLKGLTFVLPDVVVALIALPQ